MHFDTVFYYSTRLFLRLAKKTSLHLKTDFLLGCLTMQHVQQCPSQLYPTGNFSELKDSKRVSLTELDFYDFNLVRLANDFNFIKSYILRLAVYYEQLVGQNLVRYLYWVNKYGFDHYLTGKLVQEINFICMIRLFNLHNGFCFLGGQMFVQCSDYFVVRQADQPIISLKQHQLDECLVIFVSLFLILLIVLLIYRLRD